MAEGYGGVVERGIGEIGDHGRAGRLLVSREGEGLKEKRGKKGIHDNVVTSLGEGGGFVRDGLDGFEGVSFEDEEGVVEGGLGREVGELVEDGLLGWRVVLLEVDGEFEAVESFLTYLRIDIVPCHGGETGKIGGPVIGRNGVQSMIWCYVWLCARLWTIIEDAE